MLAQLRHKSQLTIPKEFSQKLGLREGDYLDIEEENGALRVLPVAVYPKDYLAKLTDEIAEMRAAVAAGTAPVYESAQAAIDALHRLADEAGA
ncbi:MAG: AbrB/MazE/SpoVT family DNA-binding domain-containing protein [Oscillospiraceae bacterium]|nr:AbrB/MazE/SpoVT family DNA-binding domain-containing protein [Oscillospiraceae bacterium]